MTVARGNLTKAGLVREATTYAPTYPAAAPAAVARLLPLLAESLSAQPQARTHARVEPTTSVVRGAVQALTSPCAITLQATYAGLETLWSCALGMQARRIAGTSQPQDLTGGAYLHTFEIDPELHSHAWRAGTGWRSGDGLRAGQQMCRRMTFVVDRQVSAWELLSSLAQQIEISASPAGVTMGVSLVGHSVDRSSAVNANLSALSDPADPYIQFHHLEARIGAYSTDTALDAGDAVTLSGFTLGLDNALVARQRLGTGLYIGEPRRSAPAAVSGRLVLPRYTADTVIDWAEAGTTLMARFRFASPEIIGGAIPYALDLWLPSLVLRAPQAPTQGPSRQPVSVEFEAETPTAAAAGFPSVLAQGPLVVQVQSDISTNPLEA